MALAATWAAERPPASALDFNEGDFERAAHESHAARGLASPATLNQVLAEFASDPTLRP